MADKRVKATSLVVWKLKGMKLGIEHIQDRQANLILNRSLTGAHGLPILSFTNFINDLQKT